MPISSIDERALALLDAMSCPGGETGSESVVQRNRKPARRSVVAKETRLDALVRTIEGQIVPRLLMARGTVSAATAARERSEGGTPIGREQVAELIRLLLLHDSEVSSAFVAGLRQHGSSVERICLSLLAPAARELGEMWERDDLDVIQVTLGLCRLQTLLRELSADGAHDGGDRALQGSILLVPELGEQHTFGLQLVGEFFRRAQWDVWMEQPESAAALLDLVAREHFSVIGLTVACEERLPGLATRITSVRRASRNRALCVMVGGPMFLAKPELAAAVGADATASDGHLAVATATTLTNARSQAHRAPA